MAGGVYGHEFPEFSRKEFVGLCMLQKSLARNHDSEGGFCRVVAQSCLKTITEDVAFRVLETLPTADIRYVRRLYRGGLSGGAERLLSERKDRDSSLLETLLQHLGTDPFVMPEHLLEKILSILKTRIDIHFETVCTTSDAQAQILTTHRETVDEIIEEIKGSIRGEAQGLDDLCPLFKKYFGLDLEKQDFWIFSRGTLPSDRVRLIRGCLPADRDKYVDLEQYYMGEANKTHSSVENAKMTLSVLRSMRQRREAEMARSLLLTLAPRESQEKANDKKAENLGMAIKRLEIGLAGLEQKLPLDANKTYDALIGNVDRLIDSYFAGLPLPPAQTVRIHVRETNGIDDLMLAVRAVQALRREFSTTQFQVSIETWSLGMDDAVSTIKQELGLGVPVFPYYQRDVSDPSLVVAVASEPSDPVLNVWKEFNPKVIHLHSSEEKEPLKEVGLSDSSLGLFLEQDEEVPVTRTNWGILSTLESEQIKGWLLSGKTPSEYEQRTKLFFGDALFPHAIAGFIKSIVEISSIEHGDLDFFVKTENMIGETHWRMHRTSKGLAFLEGDEPVVTIPLDFFAEHGIGEVEIVKFKRQGDEKSISTPIGERRSCSLTSVGGEGDRYAEQRMVWHTPQNIPRKKIRILDGFPLPHSEIMKFLKGSEQQSLCTGSQGYADALSVGKQIFYEITPRTKQFSDEIASLARSQHEFFGLLTRCMLLGDSVQHEQIAEELPREGVEAQFALYRRLVYQRFSLANRLANRVRRVLWGLQSRPLNKALKEVNRHIAILVSNEKRTRGCTNEKLEQALVQQELYSFVPGVSPAVIALEEEVEKIRG